MISLDCGVCVYPPDIGGSIAIVSPSLILVLSFSRLLTLCPLTITEICGLNDLRAEGSNMYSLKLLPYSSESWFRTSRIVVFFSCSSIFCSLLPVISRNVAKNLIVTVVIVFTDFSLSVFEGGSLLYIRFCFFFSFIIRQERVRVLGCDAFRSSSLPFDVFVGALCSVCGES